MAISVNPLNLKIRAYNILAFFLLFNAIPALVIPRYDLLIPIQNLLELAFLLYVLVMLGYNQKTTRTSFINLIVLVLYVTLSFLWAVPVRGGNIFDFLLIYKAFIYAICFSLVGGKRVIPIAQVKMFFWALMVLLAIKYSASHILGISKRPRLLVENNFELMLPYALYLILYNHERKFDWKALMALGLITMLSYSRSSILIFTVLSLFVMLRTDNRHKFLLFAVFGGLSLMVGGWIFMSRQTSLEEIDRFRFFLIFLENISNWGPLNVLFGEIPITPLSQASCDQLRYYDKLFSYEGGMKCYSVILHSFILRTVFDHGILGLCMLVYVTYYLLRSNGFKKDVAAIFVVIVLINGLSVSSFNNVFFGISMMIMLAHANLPSSTSIKSESGLPYS